MREATRADLPRGNAEGQCSECWKLFSNDSTWTRHKRPKKNSTWECHDPASIGLVPDARRGLIVWSTPEGIVSLKRSAANLQKARSAHGGVESARQPALPLPGA